jgi:hypothetical protein
MANW